MAGSTPTRPVLRYHGGKFRLAKWLVGHMPRHEIYVEPFGGAASVLLAKRRVACEVYNDLDSEVVNLFRVLRDEKRAARLIEMLTLTPFAREEFVQSYGASDCEIERARRLIARSFMAHGSAGRRPTDTGQAARGGSCGSLFDEVGR